MNKAIAIYRARGQKKPIEVRGEPESVWLSTHQMAELFQVDRTGMVRHISNIYRSKELSKASTCGKNAQVGRAAFGDRKFPGFLVQSKPRENYRKKCRKEGAFWYRYEPAVLRERRTVTLNAPCLATCACELGLQSRRGNSS